MKPEFLKLMLLGMTGDDKEKLMEEMSKVAVDGLKKMGESIVWKDNLTEDEQRIKTIFDNALPIVQQFMAKAPSQKIEELHKLSIEQLEARMRFEGAIIDTLKATVRYGEVYGLFTKNIESEQKDVSD